MDGSMVLTEPVPQIETPRNHSLEIQERLRQLLDNGAPARPNPKRPDFFEIEDNAQVFMSMSSRLLRRKPNSDSIVAVQPNLRIGKGWDLNVKGPSFTRETAPNLTVDFSFHISNSKIFVGLKCLKFLSGSLLFYKNLIVLATGALNPPTSPFKLPSPKHGWILSLSPSRTDAREEPRLFGGFERISVTNRRG